MKPHLNFLLRYKNWFKLLLGTPLSIIALFFVAYSLYIKKNDLLSQMGQINVLLLVSSLLLYMIFFLLKGVVWTKILKFLGSKSEPVNDIYLLSTSELKRYIPGNVFAFITRVTNYSKKQKTSSTLKGILLEQILLVSSSVTVAVPSLIYFFPKILGIYALNVNLLFFILTGILIGLVLFLYISNKIKSFKKYIMCDIESLFSMYLISVVSWIFFAAASYLGALSFTFLDPKFFIQLSSFFVLSWLIGYLSFVTPMGLGVREAAMVAGLIFFVPSSFASFIAILLRIIFTLSELLFLVLVRVVRNSKKLTNALEQDFYKISLFSLILIYSLFFSYYSIDRHNDFFSGRFDLGNMDQTIWNTLHGRFFMFTNPDSVENVSRLAFHADFLLILLTPFYFFWSDPRMLLIIQSLVIALGSYFVYLLSLKVLQNKSISLILATSYLLNPFLQRMNIFDFHAVALATTFLLASFYFLYSKKWVWGIVFLTLSVLAKENIYIIAFFMGLYLIISGKNKRLGAAISGVSFLSFILIMKVLIPNSRGGSHFAFQFLTDFGDSVEKVILSLLLHPISAAKAIIANNGIFYVFRTLLPTGLLSIFGLPFLLFTSADFLKNLLATNGNFRDIYYQYLAEIIPFVYISTIFGVSFILKKTKFLKPTFFGAYLLFFTGLSWWLYSPMPGAKRANIVNFNSNLIEINQIKSTLSKIPIDKSVSSTNNLGAHLSQRENLYNVPHATNSADYVVFLLRKDTRKYGYELSLVNELRKNKKYILYYQTGSFYAFKRN